MLDKEHAGSPMTKPLLVARNAGGRIGLGIAVVDGVDAVSEPLRHQADGIWESTGSWGWQR